MELPAVAMVLTTVFFASVPATDDRSSGAAAQQRKCACLWTSWCCDRAPQGWQLLQLFLPWITLLFLCMACLSATGESTATMEAGCLRSTFRLSEGSVRVHDQEAVPTSCAQIDGSKNVLEDKPAPTKERLGASALGNGDVDLLSSLSAEMFDSSTQENLLPALCMLPGLAYMQSSFLSTGFQTKPSAEIIFQGYSLQEQSVAVILDWGSHSITSVSFKLLTLTNRKNNTEVRVSRILTSDTQFCTVNFQEVVLSPGSEMSILIAYIPSSIGKAEGCLLLQTSIGGYKVKTLGEGVSPLIKIHPFSSVMVVSKAEWQETISLFNPFDEPILVEEAFVWVEPRIKVSTPHWMRGEGVLCRRIGFLPECFYPSSLKVRPMANWVVAPYSSSPIMDLSIVLDDGEHLVGTLCLKIYHHSVQLWEIRVVPMDMQWLTTMIMTSSKLFKRKSPLEAKGLERQSGRAVVAGKAVGWQGQVSEVFSRSQSTNILITMPLESLKLEYGESKEIGGIIWIGPSCKPLFTSRSCCILEAFLSSELNIHINSSLYRAVFIPCSSILQLVASLGTHAAGKGRYLAEHIQCTEKYAEDSLSQKCCIMPHAPLRVSTMVKGFANEWNACGPEFDHADKSDCMHVPKHYYCVGVLSRVAEWSNGSDSELSLGNTCLAWLPPEYSSEFNNQGLEFNLRGLYVLCSGSGHDWPNFATDSSSHYQVACKLCDWSVSMDPEGWTQNDSKLGKGAISGHDVRGRNTDTPVTLQESCFMKSQELLHVAHMQMETVQVSSCGAEYAGPFCDGEEESEVLNALQFDFLERVVAEGCEERSVPTELLSTDHSLPVCCASLSFSKYQKFILKLSLLILFTALVVLVKLLKQERLLMTDVRLRQSCSHTFFLHSVCLKTSYIKGAERSGNFKHALERFNNMNSMEFPENPCYENRFLNGLAIVARSLGSVLRWVFDSQATILNVRVQIAESPCAATVDQVNYSRNSCLADGQTSNPGQESRCVHCVDTSCAKHLEATSTSPVVLSTTQCISKDVLPNPVSTNLMVDVEQTHQVKEKKDKGRRKKKRSNIIDLKQEFDRMGQSGSSSPPSSPASPATPLAYCSISPFLRSDSPSRSVKCVSNSGRPRSNAFRDSASRSSAILCSSDSLSQLDVRGEHAYHISTKKGTQVHSSKATLEPPSTRSTVRLKADSSGMGSFRKDTAKDTCTGENWAAVARRAIANSKEPDQRHGFPGSSSGCYIKSGAHVKPVLLPSATFPQRGRSMQWTPQMLDNKNLIVSDAMMSPSLVSMSLVAPHARAPGSKPAMPGNEGALVSDCVAATSQVDSDGICLNGGKKDSPRTNEYLYDIWGDHFAEFSFAAQSNIFSRDVAPEHDTLGAALPTSPRVESLFATSTTDAATSPSISRPSAGFSIFSHNAFFSPYQQEDTTGSSKT